MKETNFTLMTSLEKAKKSKCYPFSLLSQFFQWTLYYYNTILKIRYAIEMGISHRAIRVPSL